ncbi:MAG: HAMP domain-containing protein [Gammaproteobacteria bacterium]|nr:HAMP domain-containing protein [Gammaproteobacteria bacterium]
MSRLVDLPIRRKLTTLVALAAGAALLVALLASVVFELTSFRPRVESELRTATRTMAEINLPALDFDDSALAKEYLGFLRFQSGMDGGALFLADGRLFAQYQRPDEPQPMVLPTPPIQPGFIGSPGHLALVEPIQRGSENIGYVYVRYKYPPVLSRLPQYGIMFGAVALALVVVAVVLLATTRRVLSQPLSELSAAARQVSQAQDYAVRVHYESGDELGQLTRAFNMMLTTIEERESALRQANLDLEARGLALQEELHERIAAQEAQARVVAILEATSDIVAMADASERLVYMNRAGRRRLGLALDADLSTVQLRDLYPDSEYTRIRSEFIAQAERQDLWQGEVMARTMEGEEFPVSIVCIAHRDETGQLRYMAGISRDISEQRAAEQQLKNLAENLGRSNAELQQFAYVASHDLQEPLRAVAGCVRVLQQRYQGKLDASADELIQHAVDGSVRMQNLINDLLAYSRVDTRGKPFARVDMNQVLAGVLANLTMAIEESGAQVEAEPLPTVEADATQLMQLLQNLIGNAIKYRGEHQPLIRVSVEEGPGEWQFCVRDNGIGIETQYFERIFLIFQRLHTRDEYPGTGVGLAICKKVVERHGGRIWLESQPGQGAAFFFSLPKREMSYGS